MKKSLVRGKCVMGWFFGFKQWLIINSLFSNVKSSNSRYCIL